MPETCKKCGAFESGYGRGRTPIQSRLCTCPKPIKEGGASDGSNGRGKEYVGGSAAKGTG